MDAFETMVAENYTQGELDETVIKVTRDFRDGFAREFSSDVPRVGFARRAAWDAATTLKVGLTGHF